MKMTVRPLPLRYHHEFRISRGGSPGTTSVLVELSADGLTGRGEGVPVRFYGWPQDLVTSRLEALAGGVDGNADWFDEALRGLEDVPPARFALETAWLDLQAQRTGQPLQAWLGLPAGQPGLTSFTIGLAPLDEMLAKAEEAAEYPILKVKCGGPDDLAAVRALREATGKRLWVDANGGWQPEQGAELSGALAELGVEMIEQPVPREDLDGLATVTATSPIPVVADESCHTADDIPELVGRVDGVNLKLDKAGGIGPGIALIEAARAAGLRLMIGCFCASSVAITAAAQLAAQAEWCDLDGHLLVADDPFVGMVAPGGQMQLPLGPGLGVTVR